MFQTIIEFIERETTHFAGFDFGRLTMNRELTLFFFRVRYPFVGTPQGEHDGLPPDVLPSPPPCG
jgi:hypothetical protein